MTQEELNAIFYTFAEKVGNLCRLAKDTDEPTKEVDEALVELIDFFAVFVSQASVLHALLTTIHGNSASAELSKLISNSIKDSKEAKAFEALVNKFKI